MKQRTKRKRKPVAVTRLERLVRQLEVAVAKEREHRWALEKLLEIERRSPVPRLIARSSDGIGMALDKWNMREFACPLCPWPLSLHAVSVSGGDERTVTLACPSETTDGGSE